MLSYLHYEEIWRKFGKGLAIFINIWYYGDRKIEGMEVQAYMRKMMEKFSKLHLLNGGGACTDRYIK